MVLDCALEDMFHLLGGFGPRALALRIQSTADSHFVSIRRTLKDALDGTRQRGWVVRWNKKSRFRRLKEFRYTAYARRDNWTAARHVLINLEGRKTYCFVPLACEGSDADVRASDMSGTDSWGMDPTKETFASTFVRLARSASSCRSGPSPTMRSRAKESLEAIKGMARMRFSTTCHRTRLPT